MNSSNSNYRISELKSHLTEMFNRKDNVQKRLLKIKKQENQSLQLLDKQKQELHKAIVENDALITSFLDTKSREEISLSRELEALVLRTKDLETKLGQVTCTLPPTHSHFPTFTVKSQSCIGGSSTKDKKTTSL